VCSTAMFVPEMTDYVSGGTLNLPHSLDFGGVNLVSKVEGCTNV